VKASRSLYPGVAVALVLAGCGAAPDRETAPAEEQPAASETSRDRCEEGGLGFVPTSYRERDQIVLPVGFPDGTKAELVYPPELDLARLGVFPYSSGRLARQNPSLERGGAVGRDFWIRCGELADVLALRNDGQPPALLAQYEGADGQVVGLWDLRSDDTVHELGFQYGRWAVLVYDYVAAGAMTDSERARWAASFRGHESPDGFLILEASEPLRLARPGEHAGPELTFATGEPPQVVSLYPGECRPHRDQTKLVDGKLVEWSGGFAAWCHSDSMRIHAEGSQEFIGTLIRDLEVRNVTIAKR
jgi:hypothetical protein